LDFLAGDRTGSVVIHPLSKARETICSPLFPYFCFTDEFQASRHFKKEEKVVHLAYRSVGRNLAKTGVSSHEKICPYHSFGRGVIR
jgi:hypothetical protein